MSGTTQPTVIYCDGISTVAVHNGNVRLLMNRLDAHNRSTATVELVYPVSEIPGLINALQQVTGKR